jgi:hypothetical protein
MIDGISLWGRTCGKESNCDMCPIGSIRGTNVTCQDFAKQFPAKMLSILKEMDEEGLTYYDEYCTRFPECTLPVDVLALCTCRKAVFEGYLNCNVGEEIVNDEEREEACIRCWQEKYVADVTEASFSEE